MNIDQLSQLSVAELRRTANEILSGLETHGTLDHGSILSQAQFYIDEIERRSAEADRGRHARIAWRDFFLEIVVILLIGAELYYAIHGGNQQLAVLQTLNTGASEQLDALKVLRTEQEAALNTQKETLGTIIQMNAALQSQLGLNFVPLLQITYLESEKALFFQNFGKTDLFLWGTKLETNKVVIPEPRLLVPAGETGGYKLGVEDLFEVESKRVSKGGYETLHCELYLKNANGKKFTANVLLVALWKGDTLIFNVQPVGVTPGGW